MKMKDKITPAGVHIVNGVMGIGKPCEAGDRVDIHYTGYTENGDVFDSSVGRDPFSFVLGSNKVIKGWEDGIVGLQVGTKCTLIIPPELGYGSRSMGKIPANAILIFDIEVKKIVKNVKEKLNEEIRKKQEQLKGKI